MKWLANRTNYDEWHRWFAWFPIQVGDHYYWLQFLERKRDPECCDNTWLVRVPERK